MKKIVGMSVRDTTIIKGVALLLLLFHHCFLSPSRYTGIQLNFFPFTEEQVTLIASFFKVCVGMFVFLSGFGMTRSMFKNRKIQDTLNTKDFIIYTFKRYFSLWHKWIFIFVSCQLFAWFYAKTQIDVYGTGTKGLLNFFIDAFGYADLIGTPPLIATWWYISLAFCLILIFPVMIILYQKLDFLLIPFVWIVPHALKLGQPNLIRWSMAFVLGIYFADHYIFERIKNYRFLKNKLIDKIFRLLVSIIILLIFIKIRQSSSAHLYYEINDGVIPAFICYCCYEFICDLRYINNLLFFIGKHSMNIFLIHTFIRDTFFHTFTYTVGNGSIWIIVTVLLLDSIVISIILNFIMKFSKYNYLMNTIIKNKCIYFLGKYYKNGE